MKEYVERNKVKEYIKNYGKGAITDGMKSLDPVDDIVLLANGVDLIPAADVVEGVRCKTCRHYYCENKTCMRMSVEPEAYGEGIYINMPEDGFCNYGERKEE